MQKCYEFFFSWFIEILFFSAICKLEELFEYSENKEKFRAKTTKRKNFIEGLEQLEADLKNDSPTAAPPTKEKKGMTQFYIFLYCLFIFEIITCEIIKIICNNIIFKYSSCSSRRNKKS